MDKRTAIKLRIIEFLDEIYLEENWALALKSLISNQNTNLFVPISKQNLNFR